MKSSKSNFSSAETSKSYQLDPETQRTLGAYYTPSSAADFMAQWAVREESDSILEPCFGSGVFLEALKRLPIRERVSVFGVELMEVAFSSAISSGLIEHQRAIFQDFFRVKPFAVDSVIGNPPYIRLRSLPYDKEKSAHDAASRALGAPMDAAGSTWMAFVLHAASFLAPGGRLAFVLPYEMTYVRYAKSLWRFLGNRFGHLKVIRVKERLFPEIMQQVVLLLADSHGDATDFVDFEAYESVQLLVDNKPAVSESINIASILKSRPFIRALLPRDIDGLLSERVEREVSCVSQFAVFNIGYVSGHQTFFHPNDKVSAKYKLRASSLRPAIVSGRDIRSAGIRTSSLSFDDLRTLFYPTDPPSYEEREYIRRGEQDGVDLGYKCRNRKPWYRVPDVRIPDLILSVFRDHPSLLHNDQNLIASNSVLCGFLRKNHCPDQFLAAWYTSLTLLYCELQIHSLGGGVLVFIPGEIANVKMVSPLALPVSHLDDLNNTETSDSYPYRIGDNTILNHHLGLSEEEIDGIREGIEVLAQWRKAHKTSSGR